MTTLFILSQLSYMYAPLFLLYIIRVICPKCNVDAHDILKASMHIPWRSKYLTKRSYIFDHPLRLIMHHNGKKDLQLIYSPNIYDFQILGF
jgi:hypothetical protein